MRIIKKLDLYIFKNFITLFAGTFCISLFAVMMQFLWKYVDDLVGKGLGMDVIGKFFFYAAETLVPTALPLAVLLASLISFGNLGERLELLSIKAAGISLFRSFYSLIFFVVVLAGVSLYFQNVVAPEAQKNLLQLRYSLAQKSPELEIPEGVFYDGIDGINLYVKQKDEVTGMLHDVVIYNMRDGVDNVHIILSDSARLETSSDKQFLLLHLYSGEQFENLPGGMLNTQFAPYRRETFVEKHFLIDFDMNLNMIDADAFANSEKTKDLAKLLVDIDSLKEEADSLGHSYYNEMLNGPLYVYNPDRDMTDTTKLKDVKSKLAEMERPVLDSLFVKLKPADRQTAVRWALNRVEQQQMGMDFKEDIMDRQDRAIRKHWIAFWQKIMMALTCILFFFVGAPLGAIIRKGGLGLPVVVAVIIFIIYYIIDTGATNMALEDGIPAWLGPCMSMIVLAPVGIFFTVKANNDSVVFNIDSYKAFFRKLLGIRVKRHLARKEVIINDPDYPAVSERLQELVHECRTYRKGVRRLLLVQLLVHIIRNRRDEKLEWISDELEDCVEELSNARDRAIFHYLNRLPILRTEPRFHNRLRKDLKTVIDAGEHLIQTINEKRYNDI
ncbi:MAG: LptF/LptG family permease [Bacteroidaceae bacterium]|nr:LptF/LptG family permease [Bacteroidaceae bacterium]